MANNNDNEQLRMDTLLTYHDGSDTSNCLSKKEVVEGVPSVLSILQLAFFMVVVLQIITKFFKKTFFL